MRPLDQQFIQRIQSIERRLNAIEERLGVEPEPAETKPVAGPTASEQATPPAPPPVPPRVAPDLTPSVIPGGAARTPPPSPPVQAPPIRQAPPQRPLPPRPRAPRKEKTPWSWEQLIGGKLFAAVGALVVVTGLGLFLKLAYDYGWLEQISNSGKCLIGAGFGAVLIVAGEIMRKRWNALASAGISAAGLGALYASAYSAYTFYELLSPELAFGLLALVSLIGVAIALRAKLATVAILSILSAYLTPILMANPDAPPIVLPSYLLALTALGLVLSAMHIRFRVLRSLVWWGTALLGGIWVLMRAADAPTIAVIFCALTWLAFHAELLWSARHGGISAKPNSRDAARPLIVSLSTTAWSVLLAAFTIEQANSPELWLAPGVAMAITVIGATILSGHLRVLRDRPTNDEERLGAVLLVQAGALLIATVAMGVTLEWLQVACWLVFGLGAILAGRWTSSRSLDVYGLIILTIGLGRLILLDSWFGPMRTGGHDVWGLILTEWSLMVAIAGLCWLGAGRLLLIRMGKHAVTIRAIAIACSAIGVGALIVSIFHEDADTATLAVAWPLFTIPLIGAHLVERRLALDTISLGALVVGAIAWSHAHVLDGWNLTASTALIHPGLISALLIVVITAVIAWWHARGRSTVRGASWVLAAAAFLLFLVSTSFELTRHVGLQINDDAAQPDALAIWWTICAGGALLWGAARKQAFVWVSALALLALASITWLAGFPTEGWDKTARALTLHPGLISAVAMSALMGLLALRSRGQSARVLVWIPLSLAVALVFASTSFELARHVVAWTDDATTRAGVVSIWWGLYAIALLIWGGLAKVPGVRWTGLGLLALATGKAIIFDLSGVDPAWRVASFLALGLLLLGVGAGYMRRIGRTTEPLPEPPTEPEETGA